MTNYESMTDEQIERLLRARAAERNCELLIEDRGEGFWIAAYTREEEHLPGDDKTVHTHSVETGDRRRAMIGLAMQDDLEKMMDR